MSPVLTKLVHCRTFGIRKVSARSSEATTSRVSVDTEDLFPPETYMGQCMSCKVGKHPQYAYSLAPGARSRYHPMDTSSVQNETKGCTKRATPYTRGQATLFGFKRRPASANPSLAVSPSPDHSDNTTNKDSLHGGEPLPSTPRPSRPRRDAGPPANRFGFRTPSAPPATNKVSDINCNPAVTISHPTNFKNDEYKNSVNLNKERAKGGGKLVASANLNMKGSANSVVSNGSCSVGHLKNNNLVRNYIPQPTNHPNATKFTLQTSSLPRPQFPVRLTSVEADTNSKVAKTVANNTKKVSSCSAGEESSSKEGSLNGDSGVGSHQSGAGCNGETDTLHGIELLDSSPTFGYRRNRHIAPRRILGTIVKGQYFDVRDLKDDESAEDPNVITEISLISIPTTKTIQNTGLVREMSQQLRRNFPALRENNLSERSSSIATSSDESREDEGLGGEEDEEKMFRDRSNNEKSSTHKNLSPPRSIEEEDWGHGEAMAEGYTSSGDESPYSVTSSLENVQPINGQKLPRPVVLTIEDSRFAAIAASAPDLIEDERSPVDSVFSSSPPTSIASDMLSNQDAPISLPKDNQGTGSSETGVCGAGESAAQPTGTGNTLSPDSPGTPTNASNSLSLSEGRDFLIDDEIADQPGLTFDDGGVSKMGGGDMTNSSGGCSSQILSVMENSVTLVDSSHKPASKLQLSSQPEDSPLRGRRMVRAGSVDTLSPCESITSDDLMLDYECSQGSSLDCTADSRLEISNGALHDLDEETLMSELEAQGDSVLKEWSNLLGAHQGLPVTRPARALRSRTGSSASDSPHSLDSKTRSLGSPLRPPRQVQASECEDGSIRLDRGTYQYMFQDIVSIKTMLLKLKRVLQENEENGLTRAETLNPFDSSLKNGLFYSLASSEDGGDCEGQLVGVGGGAGEEVTDLRRQTVLLQQQLEEKERTIQLLQVQMTKYTTSTATSSSVPETCNAATQTERVRPVSAGPSLLQSLPSESNMGPLVSSSDVCTRRQSETPLSRLPMVTKNWRRTSLTVSSAPSVEQSNIPTRKLNSLSLLRKVPATGNGLPPKS